MTRRAGAISTLPAKPQWSASDMVCRKSGAPWPSSPVGSLLRIRRNSIPSLLRNWRHGFWRLRRRISALAGAFTSLPAVPKPRKRRSSWRANIFWKFRQPSRYRVVARKQSYHGSTLGAMSVSGNVARRAPYAPMIPEWGHVAPCFCYHCPFDKTFPECNLACADDLDSFLHANDASTVAAFFFEPVVGATLRRCASRRWLHGAHRGNLPQARHSADCRRSDDRHGTYGQAVRERALGARARHYSHREGNCQWIRTAWERYSSRRVWWRRLRRARPPSCTDSRIKRIPWPRPQAMPSLITWTTHKLFERVTPAGETLRKALAGLEGHPHVGQVRGLGLLQGVEFVKDKATREPFPKEAGIAEKIRQAALEKNVLLYPGQGCVDGLRGDHVLLAPPFIIKPEECALIAESLQYALDKVFSA